MPLIFEVDAKCAIADLPERASLNESMRGLGIPPQEYVVSYVQPHFGNKGLCFVQTKDDLDKQEVKRIQMATTLPHTAKEMM